jgi:predicted nucleic acid-binding protein
MPSRKSDLAVLDTSVYIENFRSGRFTERIIDDRFIPRCSAVVLHELMRGARTRIEIRFVRDLLTKCRIVTPTVGQWVRAGEVLALIRQQERYDGARIRELAFDVLIALSAQAIGARLITCDAADFTLIRRHVPIEVTHWA